MSATGLVVVTGAAPAFCAGGDTSALARYSSSDATDDERSNVESLEKIFQREGMRVLVANDAKHALAQVFAGYIIHHEIIAVVVGEVI